MCESFVGVGVVLVAGFEEGVAAQVFDGVHGEYQVAQVRQVFEQRQFDGVLGCGAHAQEPVGAEELIQFLKNAGTDYELSAFIVLEMCLYRLQSAAKTGQTTK